MAYEYRGKEIVSELIINQNCKGAGKIKYTQKVDVKCSRCLKVKNVGYGSHVKNRLKSLNIDYICHSCVASIATSTRNSNNKGKSIEDILGNTRGAESRSNRRQYSINNNTSFYFPNRTGMSWEESYGVEKAEMMKIHHRSICKLKPLYGAANHQFGKPAHYKSGAGVKGYYKDTFFRSLMEASFLVNYLEKNNLVFENGELKKYAFKYILNSRPRNYFCDFVVGNTFYEIKPKALHKTIQNTAKWSAANKWCIENNKMFKVFSEKDYEQLSQDAIDSLIEENKLLLI